MALYPFLKVMIMTNDFLNYMGYRQMILEDKIRECLDAAHRGETGINIDRDDLTDDEVLYVQNEVQRRIEQG